MKYYQLITDIFIFCLVERKEVHIFFNGSPLFCLSFDKNLVETN